MKKYIRYLLLILFVCVSLSSFYFFYFILFQTNLSELLINWVFWVILVLFLFSINEMYHYAKIGKRSEGSDIVAILFFVFLIFFITEDIMTSIFGAFSIYLWFGIYELREYPVINKLLIITLVTYNVIFVAGLVSFYLQDPFYLNTAFAFSFWIILGLGFLLFGRKYIVVWRFMSPAYLIMFLYIIAWLAIIFINQYTPIDFNVRTPIGFLEIQLIYPVLIGVNWFIYFISGPILDKLLGIKRVKDEEILQIVENVKKDIGISGKVKVGFGTYPILNAMAYGSVFDKRIAIIAENINQIPKDELKGIIAHELAHTKGKHTLILTLISTLDLIVRMLLKFPATYYDYTFGDPEIPMIAFIITNLTIYIFLFILVRILEGKADLKAKKAGYAKELAKALYNLESFYATGREFGLNTMLLCEEKITNDNKILDYIDTAEYISHSMIKPKRLSLLANFMNSHPPTYFRIAALLDEGLKQELKPFKEALLPFICLKRSKQRKYAKKFEKARIAFKIIANEKFKELFNVDDISLMLENLGRREIFNTELKKNFIFKNLITQEKIIGKFENIQFLDDVCDTDQYIVTDLKSSQTHHLNASLYTKTLVSLNDLYYFKKDKSLLLKNVELKEDKINGDFTFFDKENDIEHLRSINKTKLPISVNNIRSFKDQDIFLKLKGELKILKCMNIISAENFKDYALEFSNSVNNNINNTDIIRFKLSELIIRPRNIFLSISRSKNFRKSEFELINWLVDKKPRTYIYLKKPVNNIEIGRIIKLNVDSEKDAENDDENNYIIIRNIFSKEIKIPYKKIEMINFEYTAIIQKKSETSRFTRLAYKVGHKINPSKVLI